MMERREMEAERGAWRGGYICVKRFSRKPSVPVVRGGRSDHLTRNLLQHMVTATHHQTSSSPADESSHHDICGFSSSATRPIDTLLLISGQTVHQTVCERQR